jgi:hypothetical protein
MQGPPNLSGFISHNAQLRRIHVLEVCRFRPFQKGHTTDHQLFSLKYELRLCGRYPSDSFPHCVGQQQASLTVYIFLKFVWGLFP